MTHSPLKNVETANDLLRAADVNPVAPDSERRIPPDWPNQASLADSSSVAPSFPTPPTIPPRPIILWDPRTGLHPASPPQAVTARTSSSSKIIILFLAASACGGLAGFMRRLVKNAVGRMRRLRSVLYKSQYIRWSAFVSEVRALQAVIIPLPAVVIEEQNKTRDFCVQATDDVAQALTVRIRAEQKMEKSERITDRSQTTRTVSTIKLDYPSALTLTRLVSGTLPKCTLALLEFARGVEEVTAVRKRTVEVIRSTKDVGRQLRRSLTTGGHSYKSPYYVDERDDSDGDEMQEEEEKVNRAYREAFAALKDEIRGVKGVLLNRRNFPSPFVPPG